MATTSPPMTSRLSWMKWQLNIRCMIFLLRGISQNAFLMAIPLGVTCWTSWRGQKTLWTLHLWILSSVFEKLCANQSAAQRKREGHFSETIWAWLLSTGSIDIKHWGDFHQCWYKYRANKSPEKQARIGEWGRLSMMSHEQSSKFKSNLILLFKIYFINLLRAKMLVGPFEV